MIAEVIIDIKNKQVNKTFDYLVPPHLEDIIDVGFRVYVPFGSTKRTGYVVNIKNESPLRSIKQIFSLIDVFPILNKESIELAKRLSMENFSYYSLFLDSMIPKALKIKYDKIARLNTDNPSEALKSIFKRKEISLDSLDDNNLKIVFKESKLGNVILDTKILKRKDDNVIKMIHLNDSNYVPTSKQRREFIEYLNEIGDDIEFDLVISDLGISKAIIKSLEESNVIKLYDRVVIKEEKNVSLMKDSITLNEEQKTAFSSIDFNKHDTYLLHGITGSGKTEVYLNAINEALKLGKTALMLVPEISLTPQITNILYSRFDGNIAILHSRLTVKEKYLEWMKIINKEVKIVVGARSAIFANLDNLGVIIVDEAHEASYIQTNNPKYNAIDVAKIRAKNHNIPLILGTATPLVTDYYYATNGIYKLLELTKRTNNNPLPSCDVIDLKDELRNGNKTPISNLLTKKIKECYKNKEQSILFLNRRGHSTFVMCRGCGDVIKCPHCDLALTYHKYNNSLSCHQCGYNMANVKICPNCGSDKIRFLGTGIEKIVDTVKNIVPGAKILEVDLDTVKSIDDYNRYYTEFKNGNADIMIGTQMIAKGLDFENVTLVGVLNADLALYYPKYDSNQVAYNLIEQVSGRAGRSKKSGSVVIQTYNPSHYVIETAKCHDYDKFYSIEIKNRELNNMPPFSNFIEILVESENKKMAIDEAIIIKNNLKRESTNSIIYGPSEAPLFKKNDKYRFIIQVIVMDDSVLNKINELYPYYQNNKDINLSITRM